mgnify:CR=1 FL=1
MNETPAVYTIPAYDPDETDRKPPYVTTYTRSKDDRVETSLSR